MGYTELELEPLREIYSQEPMPHELYVSMVHWITTDVEEAAVCFSSVFFWNQYYDWVNS